MRTLRELTGWALVPLLVALPLGTLGAVASWLSGDAPLGVALLGLLALTAWPGLWLWGRRLREPPSDEVAEADGRPAVLLTHAFCRAREPIWARIFAFAPGFWRDVADERLERALRRGLSPAGPLIDLARPSPPPAVGPVRPPWEPAWADALERRLRRSRRAVVVFDGTPACRHEIRRARELLGPERVYLVPHLRAAQADEALAARWRELRAELPWVPALEERTAAVRFRPGGQAEVMLSAQPRTSARLRLLREPSLMLRAGDARPAPKPPSWSWFLTAAPLAAAMLSALSSPLIVQAQGDHVSGGKGATMGLVVLAVGAMLAALSRRAVRLVPANEAVMVFVAACPWLAVELGMWMAGRWRRGDFGLRSWLEAGSFAATYSAPLLLATSIVLAGASLMRHSPGRSGRFAAFGLGALLPMLPMVASLSSAGASVAIPTLGFFGVALAVGLATAAASGEGRRPHAPLPVGAAAAAALALAAWMTLPANRLWREATQQSRELFGAVAWITRAEPLVTFDRAWPWFLLLVPATVVLVGAQFTGRSSRAAVRNLLALVPLVVAFGLIGTSHGAARSYVEIERGRWRTDVLQAAVGTQPLARGFHLMDLQAGHRSAEPVDVVVDRTGHAFVFGERLRLQLEPPLPLRSAVRRLAHRTRGRRVRIAADGGSGWGPLRHFLLAAASQGVTSFELVGDSADGPRAIPFRTAQVPGPAVLLSLSSGALGVRLVALDGTNVGIASQGWRSELPRRLAERRAEQPSEGAVGVLVGHDEVGLPTVKDVMSVAARQYPDVVLVP